MYTQSNSSNYRGDRKYYGRRDNPRDRGPRKNHQIRVQEVQLIDENDENVGVVSIQEAMTRAKEAEMDLVEVSPNAKPPVCRIMDYSKYLYEQRKKQKKNKVAGKVKDMKEFRFSPVIEENDINTKARRAKEYLEKGHQVRLTMQRKGRQTREQAESTFRDILTKFDGYSSIEPKPKVEGKRMFITLRKG